MDGCSCPVATGPGDGATEARTRGRPDLKESIKWGNPVYEKNGRVCYLAATEAYVSLGFFYGAALTDPGGRIEGTGVKMRHIKVRTLADIHADQFAG